jgi:hypothetical protein
MKVRRKVFNVKFRINYPSGKSWTETKEATGVSEAGAIDTIKWIHSSQKSLEILSCEWTGKYIGSPITPSMGNLGEY